MDAPLPSLAADAQEMCQQLLRIDTTNPPGNERPAADYLAARLREVGYDVTILEPVPTRANLVARYPGDGRAAPLLLTAHLDVVEADASKWKQPPFGGVIADGCLWGRGAIDMKNMAAMAVAIMRRLAVDKPKLARDVIFAGVADEEAGCDHGSRFLVDEHPELVRAEYALGESGGFSLHLAGTTYYPVQVAEKGLCWVRARFTGEPGHGSMPRRPDHYGGCGVARSGAHVRRNGCLPGRQRRRACERRSGHCALIVARTGRHRCATSAHAELPDTSGADRCTAMRYWHGQLLPGKFGPA